jgi:hypothetical protein
MSDPITEANRLVARLEHEVEQLRRLEYAAAEAEVKYRVARADAYEAATGSVAAREKQVDRATATESLARYKAAADVRVQNELLRILRQKVDLKRTEAATDRALSGMGT